MVYNTLCGVCAEGAGAIKDLCLLHERCSYRLSAGVLQLVCPSIGNAWLCFLKGTGWWRIARVLVRVSAGVDAEPGSGSDDSEE